MADLSITGEVVVTSEKAEGAFDRVGAKAGQMASKVQAEATKAGAAVDSIGAGAEQGAEKFTRAESRMRSAIQKSTRELEMLGKTASQKFEAQLEFKGLDKAKFQPFLDELRKAEEATKKAESGLSGLGSAAQAAGRAMAVAFSGAAAFGVVGKLVEVQREFDVLNSSLKTVTGSSAAAERELSWLKTFAKETPFGLAQATQGFVKMKALGLDPTRAALTSFGNTASAMGKDLNQMIEAVADASTGEFERLKEFGIKAKKEGDNVSLTFQGVTTTIKNSASEITKYLEDIGNVQFGGAMAERAKTLDGAIAELGDTWDELFRTINERNAGTLIYDSIKLANGAIEDATTIIKAMTAAYDESGQATGAMATIQNGIATVFETVAVLGANLKYVLVQIGNEIGGLAAQVVQAAQFNFAGVRAIREQMVADAEAARREIDATTERILNARKEQEEYARWATRNASAATDPRRIDLGTSSAPTVATRAGARATKEALSEYDKLMQRLGVDLPKAAAAAEAAQHGYNKSQEEFIALAGSPVWAGFTNQQRAQVAALFENRIASEQAADAAKTLAKANLDAAASREKYLTSLSTGLDKIKADTAAQLEATARLGLSKEAIAELDAAKLEMLATDLELQAIKAMDRNLDEQTYNALKQQAEAYRELAAAKKAGATKEMALDLEKANREAAKKAADEWERASDDINRSLTDALMRGFESGKDFAENLRDTLKNMFSTLVLRPIISAVMSPVSMAINGVVNSMGMGAASSMGTSLLGNIGSSALISGLGSSIAGAVGSSLGAIFGTGVGNVALGTTLGLGASSSTAAALAAAQAGGAATGGIASAGSLFSGIGAAMPWIAGIAALASILGGLDDSGTLHTGGAAQYSSAGGLRTSLGFRDNEEGLPSYNPNDNIDNQFGTGFGWVVRGDQAISAVSAIAQGLGTALDGIAVAFGQTAGYEIATAFADDSSGDGAWGALRISKDGQELLNWQDTRTSRWAPKEFGDGEEGYKQYLAAVAKDTRQVLLDMDLPSWADKMLESLGDSVGMDQLQAVITQIGAIQTAFVGLGKVIDGFAGMTDKAFEAIMKASGGIEALSQNAATYYQNFYSEEERTTKAREQVQGRLTELGVTGIDFDDPKAREQYRKAVEDALARANTQQANREAVTAALSSMDLSGITAGGIGDVLSGIIDTSEATPEALQGLARAMQDLGASATGLQDFEQAVAAYINANAEALGVEDDAAALAAGLLDLSGAFAAVTRSAEQEAARLMEIESKRGDLTQRLLRAEGKDREALDLQRAKENEALMALDPELAKLAYRLWLLEDAAQAAADKVAAQEKSYRALQAAYDRERKALEAQLDGIDQARTYFQEQQSLASESLGLITGVFDLLHDSVQNLYGDVEAAAAMQAEQGRAFIAQALTTAVTTGYLPEQDQLSEAIRAAVAGVNSGTYANTAEQDFAKLVLAGQLRALEEVTGKQKTDAEKQLDALEKQLKSLDDQTDAIEKQLKLQQESLDYWQEQIDIANGVYDATLSVEDAVRALAAALGMESANTKPKPANGGGSGGGGGAVFGGGGSGSQPAPARYNRLVYGGTAGVGYEGIRDQSLVDRLDKLSPVYHSFDGTGDLAGLAAAVKAAGGTIADLSILSGNWESDWRKAFEGVGIPAFAVGTNYVPRDMVAQIHEGEAIVPKAFNPWANGGSMGSDNTALIAEIRSLREEVAGLRAAAEETAGATGATADVLVRVTQNGNGMVTTAALL